VALLYFNLAELPMAEEVRFAGLEVVGLGAAVEQGPAACRLWLLSPFEPLAIARSEAAMLLRDPAPGQPVDWQTRVGGPNPAGWSTLALDAPALDLVARCLGRTTVIFRLDLPPGHPDGLVADPEHEHSPRLRLAYVAA